MPKCGFLDGYPRARRFPYEFRISGATPSGFEPGHVKPAAANGGRWHSNGGGWVAGNTLHLGVGVDVAAGSGYPVTANAYKTVTFTPVSTTRLRVVLQASGTASVGLLEVRAYAPA
ncbi:hypothetical protein AB0G04_26840 [Actinoplanes sp. NPDC023801]|uniref:hypothetical protein n=1 Tax=Actinoplanes sp. NPDC023801 TaxID=3154595 RepID=UPI0033DCC913